MSRPTDTPPDRDQAAAWWRTGIIDMAPDRIRFRGCPVQQLIGRVSFVDMIWFLVVGVMPSPRQARLARRPWSPASTTARRHRASPLPAWP